MTTGNKNDELDDLWRELTEPRALEGSMSDLLPSKDDSADARDGKAMLGKLVLERFRVDKFLDGGSVGRIYAGTQLGLGRPVAIKVLRKQDGPRGELAKKRFEREAQFLAEMNHPNVVEMIHYGATHDGDTVMVMELLEGHTLKDHIEQGGPLPVQRVLHIARQLAEAVGRAHDLGGVHRDLKPANVFIERDDRDRDLVKVLDFGLVKPSGSRQKGKSLTLSGYVLGTPFYMSPEQAMGERLDARADIYSFGVMLYEMLTGVPPYRGDTVAEILTKHLEANPPPLAAALPTIRTPARLELLVRRCLAKNPNERPDSMYTVVQELEVIEQEQVRAEAELEASLANWDPMTSSSDFPRPDPSEDPNGDWIEPSIPGTGDMWMDQSQPPLVQAVDGSSGGVAAVAPWDERSGTPMPVTAVPLPSAIPSQHPAPMAMPPSQLMLPSSVPAGASDSSELFEESRALVPVSSPNVAPMEGALVPVEEGGQLLPPPSITPAPSEVPQLEERRSVRLWLLVAGILMIAVALGLVHWAQSRFDQPEAPRVPRPRAALDQGHMDSAPTASPDMPKA